MVPIVTNSCHEQAIHARGSLEYFTTGIRSYKAVSQCFDVLFFALSILCQQSTQTKVVDHILHFFHLVLDSVAPLPQAVVLEVENLEAGVNVFDELADLQWAAIVSQCDRVACKPRELFDQRD